MTKRLWILFAIVGMGWRSAVAAEPSPEWIVITAPAFRSAIEPLCEHRRAEGMHVEVVQTTDVLSAKQIREGDAEPLKVRIDERCRQAKGKIYVLLVGAVRAAESTLIETTVVPPLRGISGRMTGEPSDNGYGSPDERLMPAVAVGRFPARTKREVEQMVAKTLAFERDNSPSLWRNRLTLLVGHPGGASAIEKRFAETFLQQVASSRFGKIDPMWTAKIVIHAAGSPFAVPDEWLRTVSTRYLQEGQIFSVYLGHSSAAGLWSAGADFLSRDDWANLKIPSGAGVLVSCGCFGCQLEGRDGAGYGLAAMRNAHGPAAVIGAHGESYAALGQLAIDGMLRCLSRPDPPERLAGYWLAATEGMARGKMDSLTFWLYDQGDGSRGTVPLDKQRLEHLEMWMLLGDPAMRLPILRPTIRLEADITPAAGKSVKISGRVPKSFADAKVQITLELPIGAKPMSILEVPPGAPDETRGITTALSLPENLAVLNQFEVQATDGRFECAIEMPEDLRRSRLVLRAVAKSKSEIAQGMLTLPASK